MEKYMKEVRSPKKPLAFYYLIVLLGLLLFNIFIVPMISTEQVKSVDYGKFMDMIDAKQIESVQIKDQQIYFTDKDEANKIYTTGVMDDPSLVTRLHNAGAKI